MLQNSLKSNNFTNHGSNFSSLRHRKIQKALCISLLHIYKTFWNNKKKSTTQIYSTSPISAKLLLTGASFKKQDRKLKRRFCQRRLHRSCSWSTNCKECEDENNQPEIQCKDIKEHSKRAKLVCRCACEEPRPCLGFKCATYFLTNSSFTYLPIALVRPPLVNVWRNERRQKSPTVVCEGQWMPGFYILFSQ